MERADPTREPAPVAERSPRQPARGLVVQAKLQVGPVDDVYEREADDVAAQVVDTLRRRTSDPAVVDEYAGSRVQCRAGFDVGMAGALGGTEIGGVAGPREPRVRRSLAQGSGAAGGQLDRETEQRIQSSRGGGRALPASVRMPMESAFEADFSAVRVHTGPQSTELSDRIQAKAFTVGSDIHFRDGLPDVSTSAGQHLLAHELTHTVQQSGGVHRRTRVTPSADAGERVRRTGAKIAGRVSRPVVQRVDEAKTAHTALTQLLVEAQKLRDTAMDGGTTLEQLAQYQVEIKALLDKADEHLASAKKDKQNWNGYAGHLKTKRTQIEACKTKLAGPEVQAKSSLVNIDATLADFEGAVARRADEAQVKVRAAMDGMRAAQRSGTEKRARTAAATARGASAELDQLCRAFDDEASKTTVKVDAWVVAASADHLAAGAAERSRQKLRGCVDLTRSILALLRGDAERAATHAGTMADAVIRFIEAGNDKKAKEGAQQRREAAATEADKVFAAADDHARKCADEAAVATKLADEALDAATEARAAASGADTAARNAEAAAKSAAHGTAVYARHLAMAPSAEASAFVEQRRGEAERAGQAARDRRAESDALAVAADQADRTSGPLVDDAADKERASNDAGQQRTTAEKEQSSAQQAKAAAERELADAVLEHDAARLGGVSAGTAVTAQSAKLEALAAAVPDVSLRSQIRLAYGDDDAAVLLGKGIQPALLLSAAPTIAAMRTRWTAADAGDVAKRMQDLGGGDLLAEFQADAVKEANDVSVRRSLDLLNCIGDGVQWFVSTGVVSANRLLNHKWPTGDVTTLLRAAEKDAKLGAHQLASFDALVVKIDMPVAKAEKLLKAGATATFLIDHALSSIETLLGVPWDVAKVVELVKAANDLCRPSKEQFEKFCTLVANNAVSEADAVAMMKGANCTGEYLVDKAFLAVRDAVVDGWSNDDVKSFVHAAENDAGLTKVQIERFYTLVHSNAFTASNVKACLTSSGVASWTFLMDRVDDFVADGNTGAPNAVNGVAAASRTFGPQGNRIRIELQVARIVHFVAGHTYKHYEFNHSNIYRGGGNQPSSMWPRGTTAANVAASALAAMGAADVQGLARNASAGTGNGPDGDFDQDAFGNYVAGVQAFADDTVLMQFFPTAGGVPPDTMAAIGRLFRGAI